MQLIDMHVHIGRLLHDLPFLEVDDLLAEMDERSIERAVVMSVENPEEVDFYVTSNQVLEACAQHPDRLIPFCSVDPRHRYPGEFDPMPILGEYVERGCRGVGEMLAGLQVDDERMQVLYAACGELRLPIALHMDDHICRDDIGLPGLERMLQQFPETVFIGHAQHFWAEISAEVPADKLRDYPTGPVVPGGALDRLLTTYPNLYGDLSAMSAYNALTRDLEFGLSFMERHQDKLLFATDLLKPGQETPIVAFLLDADISQEARERIVSGNATRLLGI
ncbi:MAG TPA: amidohydrolase [Anaerolineae bacterium]|nr:amidohydrolase [Anaerolineae bacterium]